MVEEEVSVREAVRREGVAEEEEDSLFVSGEEDKDQLRAAAVGT